MRVLLVGGGGREHALAWKLVQSPRLGRLYAAPGNPGIAAVAECVAIRADAVTELADFAARAGIDLVVVGPEGPLALGLADLVAARGIPVFGPTGKAAALESSKVLPRPSSPATGSRPPGSGRSTRPRGHAPSRGSWAAGWS